jgi:GntR family transcriptional regulator
MNVLPEPEIILEGGQPPGEQIEMQVRRSIENGQLRPGEQLPTIRAMAVGLGLNPQVIARAYEALEAEGLITMNECGAPLVLGEAPRGGCRWLVQHCEQLLVRARGEGFTGRDVLRTIENLLQKGDKP